MKREYDLSKGKRGPVVPLAAEKVRITIRLDRDIVDQFSDNVRKAHRGNYQTLTMRFGITGGVRPSLNRWARKSAPFCAKSSER